jgi:membrane protease YdiL (CAAX protease family)
MPDITDRKRSSWLQNGLFPLVRIVVLGGGLLYLMAWTEGRIFLVKDSPLLGAAIALGLGLVAMAIYVGYARMVERREATELSLPGAGREFALGALIGAALYSACAVILMILGIYQVEGLNPLSFLIPAVAMAVKSAIFEELVFRGVLLQSVESMLGTWAGVIVSSAAFGLVHLMNPDATIGGAIYITIEAGLLLGGAYLVTRRLWMAIGFHMAWNYVQSAIFSGIVSGAVDEPGLIRDTLSGPDLLTGGSFGMERSVIALILCTTAGVILLLIALRRGNILPPPWKR